VDEHRPGTPAEVGIPDTVHRDNKLIQENRRIALDDIRDKSDR
jgi:hypothetical protein